MSVDYSVGHALRGAEARLGQVEKQLDRLVAAMELGAVINATVTGVGYEPGSERDAARRWIRDRIAEIVSRT
ncbi:hypothetical protein [Nocardia tengchongensis]|uniref:hypothetical protein n=1 Tax=Nocardia tengchongensis TaxID=2055889 RepID=UPI003649B6DD